MKVNEIILEGPISQAWQNFKTRRTGEVERAKGQERLNKIVTDALPYWFRTQAAYQQRGIDAKQMGPYLTQWARQWFSLSNIPDYSSQVKDFVDDAGVKKYLQIAASYYLAGELEEVPQDQPKQPKQPEQPQGQATGAQAPVADTTAAQRWGTITRQLGSQPQQAASTATPQATNQQPSTAPAVNSVFQDPAAFSAEFNKYAQSIGGAQQASTKLKDTLKRMWALLSSAK